MLSTSMSQLEFVFFLMIIFQVKHYLADFPLQTNFMIRNKGSAKWNFFLPLLMHSMVHSSLTLVIVLIYAPQVWWLFLVDTGVHFIMDRVKSGPAYLGKYDDVKKGPFWWALGFDQMVHHLTDIFAVWVIVHSMSWT